MTSLTMLNNQLPTATATKTKTVTALKLGVATLGLALSLNFAAALLPAEGFSATESSSATESTSYSGSVSTTDYVATDSATTAYPSTESATQPSATTSSTDTTSADFTDNNTVSDTPYSTSESYVAPATDYSFSDWVGAIGAQLYDYVANPPGLMYVNDASLPPNDDYIPNNTFLPPHVISLTVGRAHACAIRQNDFTIWCWGSNYHGEAGVDLKQRFVLTPTKVLDIDGAPLQASSVIAGSDFTCALKKDLTVWCWGRNDQDTPLLSSPDYHGGPTPVPVITLQKQPLTNIVFLGPTGGQHACAIKNDATVWCWGTNSAGQLGDEGLDKEGPARQIATDENNNPFTDVKYISSGFQNNCAVKKDSSVWCWGSNLYSHVGQPRLKGRFFLRPIIVTFDNQVPIQANTIATGRYLTYAINALDSKVLYWGSCEPLDLFQRPMFPSPPTTPCAENATIFKTAKGDTVTAFFITTGRENACAIEKDSSVWCWGRNWAGQLGNGSIKESLDTPTQTIDQNQNKFISRFVVANEHTVCALRGNGLVWCWGYNQSGLLATDPNVLEHSSYPVQIPIPLN